MNHTPKEYEILISDDLLARIMHCDLQSGTSEKCSGCKYNNTSDCAGEVDRTHVSHDLVVARSVILRLEKERAIMLEALKTIDAEICYGYCGDNDCYNKSEEYQEQNCRLKNIIQSVIHNEANV